MTDYAHITRKARKAHFCSTCHRMIRKGEEYRRGTGFDGGDVWTWKDCAHCLAVLNLYRSSVMGYENQYNEETYAGWIENRHSDTKPIGVQQLRSMAGFQNGWKTREGNLWPIPKKEEVDDQPTSSE